MVKRSKNMENIGEYATCYSMSLRKMVENIEVSQHAKCTCFVCSKTKIKRGAGAAWTYNTSSAATVKSVVRRLKESKDQ
ncbi:60S ribosomal protein L37a-like [Epinephelus fuscoguttatus]|uniref:60S ribosomal protein L37a-like n=1 Tax=Epinephelus fuscoguttatus TaxID=293821 RepID=UPI0020D1181E|nr:60S ribosomal protein L37a-like [Epinephelus fuscoguttatus]